MDYLLFVNFPQNKLKKVEKVINEPPYRAIFLYAGIAFILLSLITWLQNKPTFESPWWHWVLFIFFGFCMGVFLYVLRRYLVYFKKHYGKIYLSIQPLKRNGWRTAVYSQSNQDIFHEQVYVFKEQVGEHKEVLIGVLETKVPMSLIREHIQEDGGKILLPFKGEAALEEFTQVVDTLDAAYAALTFEQVEALKEKRNAWEKARLR